MNPYLNIFGKQIPYYGLLFTFGLIIGGATALVRSKKRKLNTFDVLCAAVFAGIFGILGAKLLSVITSMDYIIEYKIPFINVIKNGFVFYGGLIGGFLGLLLFCKIYKLPLIDFADVFAVSVPLGHAFGRIGCFISGCCFGIPHSGFLSVIYTQPVDPNTPVGTPLLAIQLIESVALFLLYIVLVILYYKGKSVGVCSAVYVVTYAVLRFTLEFFRGDAARGFLLGVSTSQIISVYLILAMIIVFIYWKILKKAK